MAALVRRPARARLAVWALHMALPLAGLWLLIARPSFDVRWEHHASHFWLVLVVGALNIVVATRVGIEARKRRDARMLLVSLAFLASAGFLALHALATPGMLIGGNGGFVVATPVGLFLAAGFAAASALTLEPPAAARVMRLEPVLQGGLVALLAAWAVASLLEVPPLRTPIDVSEAHGPLVVLAGASVLLYGFAALRYLALHRRRPAVLLMSLITAFVLLAEAMVAVAFARNWQASWWEWHLLMAAGFGFVAYSAHVQGRVEGSRRALFGALALDETAREIRDEYAHALDDLLTSMRRIAATGEERDMRALAANVARRFELTEGQADVLVRAAESLAHEKRNTDRLGSLVDIGREARVMRDEHDLLARATDLALRGFGDGLRIGLLEDGRLRFPPDLARGIPGGGSPEHAHEEVLDTGEAAFAKYGSSHAVVLPLLVKDHVAGTIEVWSRNEPGGHDVALLRTLASQLSVAVENARLYAQLDTLFRQYMSPQVATALLADQAQATLGGAVAEITVLFADLRGFTTLSERAAPDRVVTMLNAYFGLAVPIVLGEGGTMDKFVGDAMMALFNAPVRQADHALRAARAALEVQSRIEQLTSGYPDRPRFRIGVNSGPAVVGNIGSSEVRNYTAIGDAVNVAARIEEMAKPGQVLIGPRTRDLLGDAAVVTPLGAVDIRGRAEPVVVYVLKSIRG